VGHCCASFSRPSPIQQAKLVGQETTSEWMEVDAYMHAVRLRLQMH
jgi:hypothetical protein